MTTAVLSVGSLLVLVAVSLVINFGSLVLIARWFAAPYRGWRRLLLIVVLLLAIGVFGVIAERTASAVLATDELWILLMVSVLAFEVFLFKECLGLTWKRGSSAFFMWMIVALASGYALAIPYRMFLVEAFRASSMAQAPTLLGSHRTGTCPHCGGEVYVRYELDSKYRQDSDTGICGRCWQASEQTFPKYAGPQPADAFLVNKVVPFRRWDVIVFRYPENPRVLYVMRLVGFPGETVVIRDSSVWINGERLEAPVPIRPEAPVSPFGDDTLLGSPGNPAKLGEDEYFVLGDFTERSGDSRLFGPIKREHLYGVASVIYWPPSRAGVVK